MTAKPIRRWTPDRIEWNARGGRDRVIAPKRMCNACSLKLGDPTDHEMVDAQRNWPLREVAGSCPHCRGLHTLIALPEVREPGDDPDDLAIEQYVVVCPDRENPKRTCFVYDQCGCTIPPEFDPLTTEGQAFLARPCPQSPTGEHWYGHEIGEVVCPVAGSCYHADHADDHDGLAVDTVGFTPGVYALDVSFDDGGNPVWEAVTVDEGVARRDARVAAAAASTA